MPPNARSTAELNIAEDNNVPCEKIYGPYPSAIPRCMISKDGTTTAKEVAAKAKTIYDVGKTDHRDAGTPDEWVPRDGALVRLTGRHPFNVEPPLSVHQKFKFITPSCLHYVRNHGACPRLTWEDHTVCVGGELVPFPQEMSMDDIASMPVRELPVTLVCAGNRRKEQNMIRQTIGFNWGPSGVSTNVWKGVMLRDILIRAGVSERNMGGKHVEFIGYEDLPNKVGPGPFKNDQWGKLVKYGTSIPLGMAMNRAFDVIIAYEANGERLQPDHGFPVRLIVPGWIGGRMIKWLKHINVIPHETTNHYHYHDNRILPPHITQTESLEGGWWYKPEYIFNELNINSAISQPNHNETISIKKNVGKKYEICGYAYSGGGRKITRVEVSTNMGVNWEVAEISRKEIPNDYGMYWCWIWWSLRIPVMNFVGAKELWCRAWDESNNTQPMNPTWNLMGMGNNQVFKVKIHTQVTSSGDANFRFEHPTQPGQEKGGWMTRLADKPESAGFGKLLEVIEPEEEDAAPPPPKSADERVFTLAEVEEHDSEDDVWIIVNDRVYDCTEYLELHPGGLDSIVINAGADASDDFNAIHSKKAQQLLEKYFIGRLDTGSAVEKVEEEKKEDTQLIALNPKKKTPFALQAKTVLSHDSFMLDFALPTKEHVLGLPTGKHIFFSAKINDELVLRRYTPITSDYDVGCVKFVIKAYPPCERFPKGGKMSQYLDAMKIGDYLDFRGPVGEFEYTSSGNFLIDGHSHFASKFNMIAGGTGITPVMQIASEILRHPEDTTCMSLIFACRLEGDLLMRETLDEWAEKYPNKFRVHYILSDESPKDWKYSLGFVTKPLFEKELYEPAKDCYNLMCGPPIMLERGCIPALGALGHEDDKVFSF